MLPTHLIQSKANMWVYRWLDGIVFYWETGSHGGECVSYRHHRHDGIQYTLDFY